MGRPVVVGEGREIHVLIPTELLTALDQLVGMTGESRANIVRRGLTNVLAEAGLWNAISNVRIPFTPSPQRKDTNHE